MTEVDKEIQEMRREIAKLKKEVNDLKNTHYCDLAEKATLRRTVEFLMEQLDDEAE